MKTAKNNSYKIRCTGCGAKNRIPEDKLGKNARCGKCRQALQTEALFLPQPVMISDLDFDAKVLHRTISLPHMGNNRGMKTMSERNRIFEF